MEIAGIDWRQPWLFPLRETGKVLAASERWIAVANGLAAERELCNLGGQPIAFVPQQDLPPDTGYEAHIAATGQVPTRDNLHDFFNALIWLHFPQTKRQLNGLHARSLMQPAMPGTRGSQRDAATLFDENAALFISSDAATLEALRRRDWKRVLLKPSVEFAACTEVLLFGHALLEKLVAPYKSITAHVWTCHVDGGWHDLPLPQRLAGLDLRIAQAIQVGFSSADFCHLPVLGVPGWWSGQDDSFYDDAEVFRPVRAKSTRAMQ